MTVVRTTDIHFGDDERFVLVDQIASGIDPRNDGSPIELLPEPGETVKKRFRRDEEVHTGYSAMYSIAGPGKRRADDPIVIHLIWSAPEPIDEATFRRAVPDLPLSWKLDLETQPGCALILIDDARSTTAAEVAHMLLDTMLALGAPLPTGRWRTTWSDLHHSGSQ